MDIAKVLFSRLTAEAWIAFVTLGLAKSDDERAAYGHARVQNAGLAQVWSMIDSFWDEHRSPDNPDHEALYLALGWTQATTSHQWPATEPWIARMRSEPEHWSPRAQWHLCWLLSKPDDPTHLDALRRALRNGFDDVERPGVARELWDLFALGKT